MTKNCLLESFVAKVKNDLVLDRHFFQFGSIPDLIMKNKEFVKNYDAILKVLKKVKA